MLDGADVDRTGFVAGLVEVPSMRGRMHGRRPWLERMRRWGMPGMAREREPQGGEEPGGSLQHS
jgi:hypothetical protein